VQQRSEQRELGRRCCHTARARENLQSEEDIFFLIQIDHAHSLTLITHVSGDAVSGNQLFFFRTRLAYHSDTADSDASGGSES
jgi:hypothetical protein